VGIDPVTGYLYSSGPYRELFVYDRNFPENSHELTFIRKIFLNFKYGPTQEKEYAKIYNQGGAFSPHGIFIMSWIIRRMKTASIRESMPF